MNEIPEECKIVAHWTGDGWSLSVERRDGETIAYLAWPSQWSWRVNATDLKNMGVVVKP